jgi:hypothetical protein
VYNRPFNLTATGSRAGCSEQLREGKAMQVGAGDYRYEWSDDWAQVPESAAARGGWAHPGVAVTEAGEIVTFHPSEPVLLFFAGSGQLLRSVPTDLTEGHGITVSKEGETEFLWLADPGSKGHRIDGEMRRTAAPGRVVKMTMDGRVALELERPDLSVYSDGKYAPTSVAVNEERLGGNGDIWVADGYGKSYVHRYSRFNKAGTYVGSINGVEGEAEAFACPHGIWIDYRKAEPELYIADRGNRQVQVYDLEGRFKRAFGKTFLSSPSAFARDGQLLIVAELRARLAILDEHDALVGYLGDNSAVCDAPGWPNEPDERGVAKRTTRLVPGKFNSPHGLAADGAGNIYVAEWLIGGRLIKLAKVGR